MKKGDGFTHRPDIFSPFRKKKMLDKGPLGFGQVAADVVGGQVA